MEYVALARHTPDVCPDSNSKIRERVLQAMGKLEELGKKHQVDLKSGHSLGPTHLLVMIFEAPSIEAVRVYLQESGLVQWNNIELYASQSFQEALEAPTPGPIW